MLIVSHLSYVSFLGSVVIPLQPGDFLPVCMLCITMTPPLPSLVALGACTPPGRKDMKLKRP